MASIKDIAKRVNVSVSTVSYALNGGPRSVPASVKERIFQAARDLDYRPNRLAKSLVTRRSHVIGVVTTKIEPDMAVGPYFVQMLNGIVNACEALSHDLMLFTQLSSMDEEGVIFTLLDGRCDGVILLAPTIESKVLRRFGSTGLPHVVVSGPEYDNSPSFRVNNQDGMRRAVDHLYNLGHRKIGMLCGPEEMIDGQERNEGFIEALAAHGLTPNPNWIIPAGFHPDSGRVASQTLLEQDSLPTAMCCSNDETAIQLIMVARGKGLSVPRDLSVVGFDNSPQAEYMDPGITTIAQPLITMGFEATEMLIHAINTGTKVPSKRIETLLVERNSTARPTEDTLQ